MPDRLFSSSISDGVKHETRVERSTYGFVDLLPLLFGQPVERIGVVRRGMGLRCRRRSLLILFGAFGVEFRSGGTETAMSRE